MARAQLKTVQPQAGGNYQYLYKQAYQNYEACLEQDDEKQIEQLLSDAQQKAASSWQCKPDFVPCINLLSRIELKRHNIDSAWQWVNLGLELKSDSAQLLYSAGHIALADKDLHSAAHYFRQSYLLSRVATNAGHHLAQVLLSQGDELEAFQIYRELIKIKSQDKKIKSGLFKSAERLVADFYSDELEQDILRYLSFDDVDHSKLRSLVTSLLKHKLRLSDKGCPLEISDIASDSLLLSSLKVFYFTDPVMERLLLTLRNTLLVSSSVQLSIEKQYLPLVSALARQCYLNEYIWYQSSEEMEIISQIISLINNMLMMDGLGGEDYAPLLALASMYQSPAAIVKIRSLLKRKPDFPDYINDVIYQIWEDEKSIKRYKNQQSHIGEVTNRISKKIRQQYNENPYPRWQDIGYHQSSDYYETANRIFPNLKAQPSKSSAIHILVAGCGTGQHALRLASYFNKVHITALDISSHALAYGQMKARQYQIKNIQFIQGDLLEASSLKQTFDVIECSGVLHHIDKPLQGLKVLLNQLRPGGLFKIALYSKRARKKILDLRDTLKTALPESANDIRLVREALLCGHIPGDWSNIFESSDFYSLSACRDLLFHLQEHTFTPETVQNLLNQTELNWVGMIPQSNSEQLARELFNSPGHALSLSDWEVIEKQSNDLFAGMYQFYTQKPE